MTVERALKSTVLFKLPQDSIDKALTDSELNGEAIYTKSDEKAVDLGMAGLLLTLITVGDVTEDDVSIKLPSRDVLLKAHAALLAKWGIPNPLDLVVVVPKPRVTQRLIW